MAVAALCAAFTTARAEPLRMAVFDLELIDTSLDGEMLGTTDAELRRLDMLSDRLRAALDRSENFEVVDIEPVREAARASNLQACGGCDRRFARELGADLAVTGVVHKVSNLILSISISARDVASGNVIGSFTTDIRSNTDESWMRGLDWLLEHRILTEDAPR
jgi:hypothetical protein